MSIRNNNVDAAGTAEIRKEKLALYSGYYFEDDFDQVAGSALNPYWAAAVGGAGTATIPAAVVHGGVVRLDTVAGNAGVDFARITGAQHALDFNREPTFWKLFKVNRITGVGYYVGIQRDGDEFAWLRFDTALGDTTFKFASNDTTGAVVLDSGRAPVVDRWYELRMNVALMGTSRVVYARLHDRTAADMPGDGLLLTTGLTRISASNLHRAYVSAEAQGSACALDLDYYRVFAKRWA